MVDDKDRIQPIAADFDDVAKAMVSPRKDATPDAPGKGNKEIADPSLPSAKWRGMLDLGGNEIDCYVLSDGTRVLSSGSTTKAIADVERGSLQDYVGQKALNPYIDIEKILQETIRFRIPGTQWPGLGITTEHFELICRGYVQALYEGAALTDRQRQMAIRCAVSPVKVS